MRQRNRRLWMVAVAAVVLLAAGGGVAFYLTRDRPLPPFPHCAAGDEQCSDAARAAGATNGYPARFSVGAPGVGKYKMADPHLAIPAGYQEVLPTDAASHGWVLRDCSKPVTLDHKYFHADVFISVECHGSVTITNSIIAPPAGSTNRAVLVDSDATGPLHLTIRDTTIRPEPVGLGALNAPLNTPAINDCATCTLTISHVDVANTGGLCLCGKNTLIEYSWLHDNYIANAADPTKLHTDGVFPYGGSGPLEISHSRLEPGIDAYTGQEIPNYWASLTAVVFTQRSDNGTRLRGFNMHDSFLSLGGYGFFPADGIDMVVRNNVFGPSHWGLIGDCTNGCQPAVTYQDWSGNVTGTLDGTPTGTSVPKPGSKPGSK